MIVFFSQVFGLKMMVAKLSRETVEVEVAGIGYQLEAAR